MHTNELYELRAAVRIYLPATIGLLHDLVRDGQFVPANRIGFAVTAALREAYSAGSDEELAEVARAEAALASLRLLAGVAEEPGVHMRRVVIAADVAEVTEHPELDDSVVKVSRPVSLSDVASVHVDLTAAVTAVTRAVEHIDAADMGDPDASFIVGDAEDHELAWYAAPELPFLLELM